MRLRRLAVENGVNEDVIFAGNVQDAKRYLMAFDCFALTSRYEGLPYSILEAGAAGIPVVATDVGGVSEVITHGVTGRLVPGGDATALAREIEWVRTHRAAAEVQAAAAREKIVKEFSEKEMIRRILKIYQEVAA
jgi:glycosyltransferase involved in cell wall biosynthesis